MYGLYGLVTLGGVLIDRFGCLAGELLKRHWPWGCQRAAARAMPLEGVIIVEVDMEPWGCGLRIAAVQRAK